RNGFQISGHSNLRRAQIEYCIACLLHVVHPSSPFCVSCLGRGFKACVLHYSHPLFHLYLPHLTVCCIMFYLSPSTDLSLFTTPQRFLVLSLLCIMYLGEDCSCFAVHKV